MSTLSPYKHLSATMLATSVSSFAHADVLNCSFTELCDADDSCVLVTMDLRFEIDRNQFVDAINTNEPPRNKVTDVTMNGETFTAEPFLIGDVRGFWADTKEAGNRILMIEADGTAQYAEPDLERTMTGTCEDQE